MSYSATYSPQQSPLIWAPPEPAANAAFTQTSGHGACAMVYSYAASVYQQEAFAWLPPDPNPTIPPGLREYIPGIGLHPAAPVAPAQGNPPRNVSAYGAIPTYDTYNTPTGYMTPQAGLAHTIVTGGVPVVVAIGPLNGIVITSGSATSQGVAAESLQVDLTGPCLASEAAAIGATVSIPMRPRRNYTRGGQPAEVGPDEVEFLLTAPLVPRCNPLLQDLELAFVGHGNLDLASNADTLHPGLGASQKASEPLRAGKWRFPTTCWPTWLRSDGSTSVSPATTSGPRRTPPRGSFYVPALSRRLALRYLTDRLVTPRKQSCLPHLGDPGRGELRRPALRFGHRNYNL
jgi:hypothetical protein